MWIRAFFLLAFAAVASAQNYAGTWVLKLGERNFIVLAIDQKAGAYTGTLSRPAHFQSGDGIGFSHLTTEVLSQPIGKASIQNAKLHLTADDEEYDMVLMGPEKASLQPVGFPFDAWILERSHSAARPSVATDWDPQRTYSSRKEVLVSNPEMKAIFVADQAARQNVQKLTPEEWTAIGKQDDERRKQTFELLRAGKLQTGEDFYDAAFVFQHGGAPDDYLLAHTLAMVAVAKGYSASWIGAATLDRYLNSIGKAQIFGTQFRTNPGQQATQEPYNRDLVSDALRRELEVPSLAVQQAQLKGYQKKSP